MPENAAPKPLTEIEELKARILNLEEQKARLEDLISWRDTQAPALTKELDGLKATLHDLRKSFETLARPAKPAQKEVETHDPYLGQFSL